MGKPYKSMYEEAEIKIQKLEEEMKDLYEKMKDKDKKMKDNDKNMKDKDKKIKELEAKVVKKEIDDKANSLIIKGLPIHKEVDKEESQSQTQKTSRQSP